MLVTSMVETDWMPAHGAAYLTAVPSTSSSSRTRVTVAVLMSKKAWYESVGAPGVHTVNSPVQPAQRWQAQRYRNTRVHSVEHITQSFTTAAWLNESKHAIALHL